MGVSEGVRERVPPGGSVSTMRKPRLGFGGSPQGRGRERQGMLFDGHATFVGWPFSFQPSSAARVCCRFRLEGAAPPRVNVTASSGCSYCCSFVKKSMGRAPFPEPGGAFAVGARCGGRGGA